MMRLGRGLLDLKGSCHRFLSQHCDEKKPKRDWKGFVVVIWVQSAILHYLQSESHTKQCIALHCNVDVEDEGMQNEWNVISPCIERSNGWELKRCTEKEKGSWNKWKGKVIQKGKVDNVHRTYEVKSCEAIVDHKKWAPMRRSYEVN